VIGGWAMRHSECLPRPAGEGDKPGSGVEQIVLETVDCTFT